LQKRAAETGSPFFRYYSASVCSLKGFQTAESRKPFNESQIKAMPIAEKDRYVFYL
jgi:hypothetical protein